MVWVTDGKVSSDVTGLRFGIRLKLLLFSVFLFTIPWLGYQYVWELESYLRLGQEQTLVGTARAVATALHERPKLFDKKASYLSDVKPGTDLYAHKIIDPVQLDGEIGDWLDYQHLALEYGKNNLLDETESYAEQDLSFTHLVGIYGNYLYAYFQVTDDKTILRGNNSLRIDRNDHLYIALTSPEESFNRYIVSTSKSGWVNAFSLSEDVSSNRPTGLETRIQGHWRETPIGYNIELRIPVSMLADKIAFAIADVDDIESKQVEFRIGTADPSVVTSLGTVLVPSPEIEKIVKGLQYSEARVWVLDKHRRVMARSGEILKSEGMSNPKQVNYASSSNIFGKAWSYAEANWLTPLYYRFLTKPPTNFIDELNDAYALKGQDIESALNGEPDTLWRLSPDNKAVILSAAHPIWLDGQVMGAVVVEQTTHGIRTLRNQALEKLFNVILAVMVLGTLTLFLFASRMSFRIRNLRNQTEAAIDANGKIIGTVPASTTQDEIGDLSRTFHEVLTKLGQYHNYLENMSSRLGHELRTPVAVVKSSLENLSMQSENGNLAVQQNDYVERAHAGIQRLSTILNNMSEATRLEQSIKSTEIESFSLNQLLAGCLQGYQLAYPNRDFKMIELGSKLTVQGSPDLFVQMLDKIMSNAVEFSEAKSLIEIRLEEDSQYASIYVANQGPTLPENMQSELFDSMVSIREHNTSSETPHLGLGLYIAKLIANFHKAQIWISNNESMDGVTVKIHIPLQV